MPVGRPFKKGVSGNPDGRPKGKESVKKKVWANLGDALTVEGAEKFWHELQKLKGEKYVKHYLAAMEYFAPKFPRLTIKEERKTVIPLDIKRTIVSKPISIAKDPEDIKLLDDTNARS